jgi:RNA polymerase sigma factor (sigma-70 family)
MSASPSFQRLLSRFRQQDRERADEMIVQRFAARLAALAARKMSPRLQQRVGPEDVVQSVFATFFRQVDAGRLELRDWETLWGCLAQIAVWRICRHAERHAAGRRSLEREGPLPEGVRVLDREPSPEEVQIAGELHARLLGALPEKHRPILAGLLDGATQEEVASELGTSLSTVGRVLRRAREQLEALLRAEEAG